MVCIFSYTIMTYSAQQNHNQPRIILHYPPKSLWEILGMGENPTQQPKLYSFSPPEKSPIINLHILYQKCHSFPIKQQFSSNQSSLYQLHLQLQSLLLYHFFNCRLFVHTCHANFNGKRKFCLLFCLLYFHTFYFCESPRGFFHSYVCLILLYIVVLHL